MFGGLPEAAAWAVRDVDPPSLDPSEAPDRHVLPHPAASALRAYLNRGTNDRRRSAKVLEAGDAARQGFVKDEKQSVEAVLKAKGASISSFVLYVVGEGIEEEIGRFAAEVMEQVSKAKKDDDKSEKAA